MATIFSEGQLTKVTVYTYTVTHGQVIDVSADFIAIAAVNCYCVNPINTVPVNIAGTQITIDPAHQQIVNYPVILTVVGTGPV